MITTKAGKGKLTVDIDSFTGFRTPLKKVRMANADQYIQYNNAAFRWL